MYKSKSAPSLLNYVIIVCLASIMIPLTSGYSATFGALEGCVRDNLSDSPVVGAVISISRVGYLVEVTTDSLGDFRLDNLVAGRYRLVVRAIGFDSLVVDNLNIVAGNSTSQFSRLALTGEGGSDGSTSQQDVDGVTVIDANEIALLPVRTVQDILLLQSTITESRSNAIQLNEIQAAHEPLNGPQLHVMGGRLWDEGYSLNGVNLTDPMSRSYSAWVSPHAIGQLVFAPGGNTVASAGGNGGVIDILTRRGGDQYSAMVEAMTDNGAGSGHDQNWYTARLSGPIPLLNRGHFMSVVERRWLADRNPSSKTKEILPGKPDRLPNNWQSGWSYHGRADYNFTDDLSVTLTGDKSTDEWSEYRHVYLFNIAHTPRYRDDNLGLRGRLVYRVNDNVSASIASTYRENERIQGDGVVFDDYEAYERHFSYPFSNPGLDDFRLFYVIDPLFGNFQRYKSSTVGLNAELSARLGNYHNASVAFEYQRRTLRYFENRDATAGFLVMRVMHYGYDSLGRESDNEDWRHDTKHPTTLTFYAQDRFSYKGFSLTAGLRWELFDYKAQLLRNHLNPFAFGESGGMDQADLISTSPFTRISPNVRASLRFLDRVRIHAGFGIRHQLPPLRQVYNDWRFFEAIATSPLYQVLPNAGIETVRSEWFDGGVTFQASDRVDFSLAAFWRKSTDETGVYRFNFVDPPPSNYSIWANGFESSSKGFTIGVNSRMTSVLRTSASYTWSKAEADPPIRTILVRLPPPIDTKNLDYDRRHKFVGNLALALSHDYGPVIGGIHPLEGLMVNLTARVSSGRPYTPLGVYIAAPERYWRTVDIRSHNSERSEWTSIIDVRAERNIDVGGITFVPFVWIKNLLNTENIADVWGATGGPDNTGWLDTERGRTDIENNPDPDETGLNFEQKYRLKEANPQNYGPPRQVFFGIRAEF